jgi:hypothetical protein
MDELQLVRSHSEPAGVSKEVSRIIVVKQQNSDRSVPLKIQNDNNNKADNAIESVGGNQLITTVNSINIDRAPLKEDVLQSEAEDEGKEVVLA